VNAQNVGSEESRIESFEAMDGGMKHLRRWFHKREGRVSDRKWYWQVGLFGRLEMVLSDCRRKISRQKNP